MAGNDNYIDGMDGCRINLKFRLFIGLHCDFWMQ